MNVIFIDFDGTLSTIHYNSMEDIEKRIKILADICNSYNCKVVIEASAKAAIDEETMEISPDAKWVQDIFNLFDKYGIEVIGRTPEVRKYKTPFSYIPMWKEDEIRLYLYRHPEIEHYCVIDDDDTKNTLHWKTSDLDKVRNHLVTTIEYSTSKEEEGLLPRHKEEVKKALEEENEIKRLILRRDRIKKKKELI